MKIATWNVNSIRTRLEHVTSWLQTNQIDVLCLQETKVTDKDFPLQPFLDIGYNCYISGQKSYNGVAIFSRSPLSQVSAGFAPILGDATVGSFDEQKRLIAGVIDDICIISVYVPNGSEVGSEKYQYKLHWLKLLQEYHDRDIYNPKAAANSVGLSIPERQALTEITELGLNDPFRKFTSEGGHYSWWDYRAAAFPRNNGWRIDHHYLSLPLYEQAKNCTIDMAPRKLVKPSDHAPVIVEI
ncbi:MAG: exodeoxyribonuclease III [Microcoleus sp. PH2017_17_BER_D_A]|nr:exodeoxyribonuclease III [Microcoleus sp. PH2017_17_BER_D_A]